MSGRGILRTRATGWLHPSSRRRRYLALVTTDGIPTEGHLGDVPLSSLLRTLAKSASRGIVHLSGAYASIICFEAGDIYLAHSESGPSLQQVVTGAGVVGPEGWEKATEQVRQGGTLADALVGVGGADADA